MRGKIPKTELLVTFEVVARHESYTRAAEELALTQSAVFRQVSALEEFLHTPLFSHSKKRIFLNDAGKYYLGIVKETLNFYWQNGKEIFVNYSEIDYVNACNLLNIQNKTFVKQ